MTMAATKLGLLLVSLTRETVGLASLDFGTSRGAHRSHDGQLGACSEQLLDMLGNAEFDNFTACVDDRLNRSQAHSGASAAAYADCWCAGNVSDFIRAQNCDQQRNWKWLSDVGCDDDCSSTEAQDCRANCPASCFETTSKTVECRCADSCSRHLHCLFEEFGNSTDEEPQMQMCAELALASSPELHAFQNCVGQARSNSTWDLLTNQFACLCSGDLQQEIQSQRCCETSNETMEFLRTGLCTANCSIDCSSAAAQECLSLCERECVETQTGQPSQECENACLRDSGRCNEYKVCPQQAAAPAPPPYPYVCDDGLEPNAASGCCKGIFGADRCPLLCEVQFKRIFRRPWGHRSAQCECDGCPTTKEETFERMNQTLLIVYEQAAYRQLMYIVVTRRLPEISSEMRELYAQQIRAVRTEIISHGGHLDKTLVERLHAISVDYFSRLENAADAEFVLGRQRRFFPQPSFGVVWMALISSTIVILTIALGCILPQTLRRPWAFSHDESQDAAEPPPPRMVVGRPISSKERPSDVVEGVLIQQARPGLASV